MRIENLFPNLTRAGIRQELKAIQDRREQDEERKMQLRRSFLLLSDGERQFEEKLETHTQHIKGRKVQVEELIGRTYWIEFFLDEDTGKKISIRRSEIVRVNGEWINE